MEGRINEDISSIFVSVKHIEESIDPKVYYNQKERSKAQLVLIIFLVIGFVLSTSFVGAADYFNFSTTSLSFPASGGSQDVYFETNVGTISISVAGCVTGATRTGGNKITVTCGVNSGGPRGGGVSVIAGSAGAGLSISQAGCTVPTATASGGGSICSGGSRTLTVTGSATTYTWNPGNYVGTSYTVSPTSSTTYTVTGSNGCASSSPSSVTVTVNATPAAPTITTYGSTTFCSGGSVTLMSSSGNNYLWSNGATTQSINVTTSGSYTVKITNASECQSASSSATTVTVTPAATANAGSALSAICPEGATSSLGGQVGGSATGGIWTCSAGGVSVGGIFYPNATTLNAVWVAPAGFSGSATLTLSTTGGCNTATASKNIQVLQSMSVNVGSPLPDIFKGGTSVPLGGSFGGSATGGIWSSSAGGTFSPSSTSLNATWTPPSTYTGTATLTLTATGGCYSAVASKTQVVASPPQVGVSISASANPSCTGSTVTFTATPTNGGTSPVYQWKKNGTHVGINSSTYSYTPTNNDVITCVLTSNATGVVGNPATSNAVTMVVNPNLPVSVSISATANPACTGSTVTFTATPSNGGTSPGYQWKKNGANVGTNSSSYSCIPTNNDMITCVLTSNALCAVGNPVTSNVITMVVNPSLPVSVLISASATPVCTGSTVTFTATPVNGGTSPVYQWKKNGANVGTNSSSYSFIPSNNDVITCLLTSNALCATGNPSTSNSITIVLSPELPVSLSIVASANPVEGGSLVVFTATPTNGGPAPSYQWKRNSTNVGTNSSIYSCIPANDDIITCILTSNASCSTGNPATSNAVIMSVSSDTPVPPTNLQVDGTSLTVLKGKLSSSGHWAWYRDYKDSVYLTSLNSSISVDTTRSRRYRVRSEWTEGTADKHSYLLSSKLQAQEGINLPISRNYIVTYTPVKETSTDAGLTSLPLEEQGAVVQYFDGLGRPTQTVAANKSYFFNDLVSGVGYDGFGRQDKTYIPSTNHGKGAYVSNIESNIANFYSGVEGNVIDGITPHSGPKFTFTDYEDSPLNRVMSVTDPSGGVTQYSYGTNTVNDNITIWSVNADGNLARGSSYEAGQLYMTQIIDPSGSIIKEYKDKQDQVILKQSYKGTTAHSTYYVYNDFGLLCYVISPKGSETMFLPMYAPHYPKVKGYCYYYKCDGRKRMVQKQLPDTEAVLMVYDARDRLVLVQDGKTRAANWGKWLYTQYENSYNRPVKTAWMTTNLSHTDLQTTFDSIINIPTTSSFTIGDVLTQTFYDEYIRTTPEPSSIPLAVSNNMKGMVTRTVLKKLDDSGDVTTDFFYDNKYRVIQTVITGSPITQTTTNRYDFVRNIVESEEKYSGLPTIHKYYTYDHAGRLEKVEQEIELDSQNGRVVLAAMDYNELGQLMLKKLHMANDTSYVQDIDYKYDIRGWLKSINNFEDTTSGKLYAQNLNYYDNGNIMSMEWKNTKLNADNWVELTNKQVYNFTYDGLNRLDNAVYSETDPTNQIVSGKAGFFNEDPEYDQNGNITSMKRVGNRVGSGFTKGTIDSLAYTYVPYSNKISRVTDGITGILGHNKHFINGSPNEYAYDANGNATFIPNKNLNVVYNYLNLPTSIGSISYLYDAAGNKLKKTFGTVDSYYQGSVLKIADPINTIQTIVQTGEGRAVKYETDNWIYEYDLKDHLGNTRVSFSADSEGVSILQTKDYYPFGLEMTNNIATVGNPTKYLYNGKELQDEVLNGKNLDWYDYGARFYDPAIGRWNTPDPMAESYDNWSPYNYTLNNPISFIDPDGMKVTKTDSSYVVTGDDIYTYYSNLSRIKNGEGSMDNLYASLEDASQKNDGEGGAFASTLDEQTISADMPETLPLTALYGKQDFRGSNGLLEYLWTGGNIDGVHYDFSGNPTGLAPIMGDAPTPSIGKLQTAAKAGRAMHRLYNPGSNYILNRAISGTKLRPDAVDYINKVVREYKPNNPAAVKKGWKQLDKYVKALEQKYGKGWQKFIDTY